MPSSTNALVLVTITFLVVALIFSSLSVALSDALAKPKQPGKVECGLASIYNKVRCCQKADVNDPNSGSWCTECTKTPSDPAPHDCGPRTCAFGLCTRVLNPPSGVVGGQQQPPLKTQQSPPSFRPPPSTSSSHPSTRAQ